MENINWSDLPHELLGEIFLYFSFHDRTVTLSQVCRNWANVCNDPLLNISYTIKGNEMSHNEMLQQLQAAPYLKYLRITHRNDLNMCLKEVGKYNRNLRSLKIKKCCGSTSNGSNIWSRILMSVLKKCKNIEDLKIKSTPFRSKELFVRLGNMIPNLKQINLTSPLDSLDLSRMLKGCKNLESIKLEIFPVKDDNIKEICNEVGKRLTTLKINASLITDMSIDNLLRKCGCLEAIHLIKPTEISDVNIVKLSQFSCLKYLSLTQINIDWLAINFFQEWGARLKAINLSGCVGVNDEVLRTISMYCNRLEKLNISKCYHFTQNGLRNILGDCRNLRYLNIFQTTYSLMTELYRLLLEQQVKQLKLIVYRPCDVIISSEFWEEERRIQLKFPDIHFKLYINDVT